MKFLVGCNSWPSSIGKRWLKRAFSLFSASTIYLSLARLIPLFVLKDGDEKSQT